jgi:hypothetical protein
MASLCPWPIKESDGDGVPGAGWKLYAYEAGTSTPKDMYSDADGLVATANPFVLDADGRGIVFLGGGRYKLIMKTDADAQVWLVDNVGIGGGAGSIATVDCVDDARDATLTDMRGLDPGAYDMVICRGYWAVGDGGGGAFHWDATATDTEDYGAHIVPDAGGTGRWVRDYDGRLNVRYFGAVGDAVTDDATYIGYAASYAVVPEINSTDHNQAVVIPWGNFLIGSAPGLGSVTTIFEPHGRLTWTVAINPAILAAIAADDTTQHFSCSVANAPVLAGIESLRPETFGAVGNGSTNDTVALGCTFAAIPDQSGVRIEMNPGKVYAIAGSDGFLLDSRSGLIINGNGASIKRLSGAGPIFTFLGCSNTVVNKLLLLGQGYATYGLYFIKNDSDTGNSQITVNDCYIEMCGVAVRLGIGDHNDTGAVKYCSFNRVQFVNNSTAHVHAYDDEIEGVRFNDCLFQNNYAEGIVTYGVKAEYGILEFNNPLALLSDYYYDGDFFWWVQDGAIKVNGGSTYSSTTKALLLMAAQTATPLHTLQDLHCGSFFSGHKFYSLGTDSYTGYDDATIISMLAGSRDLRLVNCDIDTPTTYTSGDMPVVVVASGAGMFTSSHCRYPIGSVGDLPWYGGYSSGLSLPIGNYRSVGDVFYTWNLNGGGWYERLPLVQPDTINQNDQDNAYNILIPTTTTNQAKYLHWGRLGASNTNLGMGKLGYCSTSDAGSEFNLYVNKISTGAETMAMQIDENIRATFEGRVSLLKGANVASGSYIVLSEGNYMHITNSTKLQTIEYSGWQSGAIVYLYFVAACEIRHANLEYGILLNGGANYIAQPGEILGFVLDVDRWVQVSGQRRMLGCIGTGSIATATLTVSAGGNAYNVGAGTVSYITYTGWSIGSIITLISTGTVGYTHKTGTVPANTYDLDLSAGSGPLSRVAGDSVGFINTGTYWRQIY